MKSKIISAAVAATLALSTFNAFAEDAYSGSWYALPGISYLNTDSELKADDGAGLSLRAGKAIAEHWDVQIGASHARANNDIAGHGGNYKQTLLGVDALYMFSREKLRPFLLAGLGIANNDVDYSLNNQAVGGDKTSWMGNVGAGVQYLFSERFGVQADLRHVWSEAKTALNNTDTVGNTHLNLAAIFNFDAPKPVVEPVAVVPMPIPAPEIQSMPEKEVAAVAPCQPKFESISVAAEKLFGFDKAEIKAEGHQILDEAAEKISANADLNLILVTGHTDKIGTDQYNQKLSERRANAVKAYLVTKGVEEGRLKALGKGESEPVVACDGVKGKKLIECLQPNRRVVLSAEKQRESACK
jgi:OmpA-OmpF porin, OOP family